MNAIADHFPDDVLEKYAMGKLSDKERAPVEEHLLLCPQCQTQLQDIDEFIQVAKAALVISYQSPPTNQAGRAPSYNLRIVCRTLLPLDTKSAQATPRTCAGAADPH